MQNWTISTTAALPAKLGKLSEAIVITIITKARCMTQPFCDGEGMGNAQGNLNTILPKPTNSLKSRGRLFQVSRNIPKGPLGFSDDLISSWPNPQINERQVYQWVLVTMDAIVT